MADSGDIPTANWEGNWGVVSKYSPGACMWLQGGGGIEIAGRDVEQEREGWDILQL